MTVTRDDVHLAIKALGFDPHEVTSLSITRNIVSIAHGNQLGSITTYEIEENN